jgi:hypothetical protein
MNDTESYQKLYGCQHCDASHAEGTTMFGGVSTRLCLDCVSSWNDACFGRLAEYDRLMIQVTVAVNTGREKRALKKFDEAQQVRVDIRAFAKIWLADKVVNQDVSECQ